jgi:putative SOS response-associated peptidase YedK
MCGRFTLRRDLPSVRRELGVEHDAGAILWEPRYNVAPAQQTPILMADDNRGRHLVPMVWGIATPARESKGRLVRHINARAEALEARSLWRHALEETRCVVVTDGFYEWTGPSGSRDRRPFWFHRQDDALILMAGLWRWRDTGAGFLQEFTIVTTPANSTISPIHDRMPAILEGDALSMWLKPKSGPKALRELLAPAADDLLESRAVSTAVNDANRDGPELIAEAPTDPQASFRIL